MKNNISEIVKTFKSYYENKENNIILLHGDSISLLSKFPSESIDVVFADPPYFLSSGGITCHAGRMVSVNKAKWDESKNINEIHEFNRKWLDEVKRILKEDGALWISGTLHNIYSVGLALQQLDYKILNDIIWYKRNAPPNLSTRYFTHSTETILWARKSQKSKHYFNYSLMKEINKGKQMRNLWDITAPPKNEKKFGKHPTQKPLELLERVILASTEEGDLVLDPFVGSGTTCIVALRLRRKCIGIDIDKEYLNLAVKRIDDELKNQKLF